MEKNKNFINIIKVACVYTGLIFGAGFASGQEHLTFFLRYGGKWGILGIILAGAVIALCGWAVLDICVKNNIKDYRGFMQVVFGKRLGMVLDIITGLFIFVIFAAMLAGAGALGVQALNFNFTSGTFILAALCFIVLLFDVRGIVEINTIITPILIVGALGLGIFAILNAAETTAATTAFAQTAIWPLSALVYSSYNMITAIAVLTTMPAIVTNKQIARAGGLLGGFFIILVGVVFAFALLTNLPAVQSAELPMLALAQTLAPTIAHAYTILLFLAIFTTAATNAFALTNWLASRTRFTKMQIKIAITALAIATAHLGFSGIVSSAYTIFGFLGLFIIITILLNFLTKRN
ncbi:MAG: hypothetical protein FWC67_00350 [Defluviitaleaceae bacterium]|nr:hypothetical protein [Defluviitaleaceae bacterium]